MTQTNSLRHKTPAHNESLQTISTSRYITEFDANLTDDQRNSEHYVIRLVFQPTLVNRPGQANRVINFIKPNSTSPLEDNNRLQVKAEDAKNPSKGYGVEVEGKWYWYESWVERCLELCEDASDRYR